jgi:hypothetical protein
MQERYVASKRHTIQVDFDDYMRELRNERRAGARRASKCQTPASAVPMTQPEPARAV